jgi:hypothetical protein
MGTGRRDLRDRSVDQNQPHESAATPESHQTQANTEAPARKTVRCQFIARDGQGWQVIGASVPGLRHLREHRPCEDYCSFTVLADICGLMIVADGAGSALHASVGSEVIARDVIPSAARQVIEAVCRDAGCNAGDFLNAIRESQWRQVAASILARARQCLRDYAAERNIAFRDLAATLICCIILSDRLLVMHVGDGRGTYRDASGSWQPLFEPVLGRNAGETVFLTAPLCDPEISSVFFGTYVHECRTDFVAIMTDGCEKGSFELHRRVMQSDADERYCRTNVPYPAFFDALPQFTKAVLEQDEPESHWVSFLHRGVEKFAEEHDDKTMLVALRQ